MKYKDNFTPEQRANYWEYMYEDAIKKSDMWRIRYEHLLAVSLSRPSMTRCSSNQSLSFTCVM